MPWESKPTFGSQGTLLSAKTLGKKVCGIRKKRVHTRYCHTLVGAGIRALIVVIGLCTGVTKDTPGHFAYGSKGFSISEVGLSGFGVRHRIPYNLPCREYA